MESSTQAPGWYPNDGDPSVERYWDGETWTGASRPSAAVMAAKQEAGSKALAGARNRLLLGTAVAVVCSVVGFRALDSDGGTVWTGGFIVALLLYVSAFKSFREAHEFGASMTTQVMVIGGVILLAGVIPALVFGSAWLNADTSSVASDCWTAPGTDGLVQNVPCDDPEAKFEVTSTVTTEDGCPASAAGSVQGDSTDEYFCLVPKSP